MFLFVWDFLLLLLLLSVFMLKKAFHFWCWLLVCFFLFLVSLFVLLLLACWGKKIDFFAATRHKMLVFYIIVFPFFLVFLLLFSRSHSCWWLNEIYKIQIVNWTWKCPRWIYKHIFGQVFDCFSETINYLFFFKYLLNLPIIYRCIVLIALSIWLIIYHTSTLVFILYVLLLFCIFL